MIADSKHAICDMRYVSLCTFISLLMSYYWFDIFCRFIMQSLNAITSRDFVHILFTIESAKNLFPDFL